MGNLGKPDEGEKELLRPRSLTLRLWIAWGLNDPPLYTWTTSRTPVAMRAVLRRFRRHRPRQRRRRRAEVLDGVSLETIFDTLMFTILIAPMSISSAKER